MPVAVTVTGVPVSAVSGPLTCTDGRTLPGSAVRAGVRRTVARGVARSPELAKTVQSSSTVKVVR